MCTEWCGSGTLRTNALYVHSGGFPAQVTHSLWRASEDPPMFACRALTGFLCRCAHTVHSEHQRAVDGKEKPMRKLKANARTPSTSSPNSHHHPDLKNSKCHQYERELSISNLIIHTVAGVGAGVGVGQQGYGQG